MQNLYTFKTKHNNSERSGILLEIEKTRLRCTGYLQGYQGGGGIGNKKILEGKSRGRRPRGKPRKRWLDDLSKMGVRHWRRVAEDKTGGICWKTPEGPTGAVSKHVGVSALLTRGYA